MEGGISVNNRKTHKDLERGREERVCINVIRGITYCLDSNYQAQSRVMMNEGKLVLVG